MTLSRRRLAVSGVLLLSGAAGCSDLSTESPLEELHLVLSNWTTESRTFHFALEADDGLGRWHDFELDPETDRQVLIEPQLDRRWSGYHAVAGDKRATGSLLGQGDERACLQLDYRITEDDIIATLPTSQPHC